MSDIKVGDRVKVTFEGVVKQTMGDYGARIHNDAGQWLAEFYYERDGASLEKVEPPVEVFGDGDLIRHRDDPSTVIFLTEDGGYTYVGEVNKGLHVRDGHNGHRVNATSRYWEKVSLADS